MASTKPRVNVTLEPEVFATLRRAAAAQGVSMSEVVRDLIVTVAPMLTRLAEIAEALERAPEEVRESLRRGAEEAEKQILPNLDAAVGDYDKLLSFAEELGQRVRDGEGPDPRPVITGVTHA